MKTILAILLIIINGLQLQAHNGAVKGQIINNQTTIPITNVTVILLNTTDTIGVENKSDFSFTDVMPGNYTLIVNAIGYANYQQLVLVEDYKTTNLIVKLNASKIGLQKVIVNSHTDRNKLQMTESNLHKYPINTSQDILKTMPGLFIAQHAGGGKAEQIFMRGFDCDHGTDIALSVDGMPVNMVSHAHGQGYADLHFVIPEMIEQVNINKGPYLAQAGNFATAGSIQMTTKTTLPFNTIVLEKGMFNNNRILAMGNILKANNNRSLIAAAEYNFNKGYFNSPMNLNRMNVTIKYNQQINKKTTLTAQITGFNSYWNASGQIPDRAAQAKAITNFGAIDETEGGNTSRINASVSTKTVLKNNALLHQQLFYNKYNFNLYSNFTFFKNDTVNGDMIQQKESRSIIGYNGSCIKTYPIKNGYIRNIIGLQARMDNVRDNELSNVAKRYQFIKPISLGDMQENNISIYMDNNIALHNKWFINTAIRYDIFSFAYQNKLDASLPNQVKDIVSPKASLYYSATKNIQLFAQVGKGFHSNDTRVVVAQQGKKILPDAYGMDIGFVAKPKTNTTIQASVWALDLQQEFIYVGDEAIVEPGDATRRVGIDIGVKHQITKRLFIDFDMNYANARIKNKLETENKIALAPPLTSTGGINYTLPNMASINVRYRHLSRRPANEFNSLQASGYTLADAVIYYPLNKFDITISAENLLNTNWREAQFETESQLKTERMPVTEMHYTSGTPFNCKIKIGYKF